MQTRLDQFRLFFCLSVIPVFPFKIERKAVPKLFQCSEFKTLGEVCLNNMQMNNSIVEQILLQLMRKTREMFNV